MLCSSGLRERKRQAVAEPDRPQRGGAREDRRQREARPAPRAAGPLGRLERRLLRPRAALADELGDVPRADDHRVDARALELVDVRARGRRQVGDRELAGGHVGQQVEHALERVVVVPRRAKQEDLRVEPLERFLELLLV